MDPSRFAFEACSRSWGLSGTLHLGCTDRERWSDPSRERQWIAQWSHSEAHDDSDCIDSVRRGCRFKRCENSTSHRTGSTKSRRHPIILPAYGIPTGSIAVGIYPCGKEGHRRGLVGWHVFLQGTNSVRGGQAMSDRRPGVLSLRWSDWLRTRPFCFIGGRLSLETTGLLRDFSVFLFRTISTISMRWSMTSGYFQVLRDGLLPSCFFQTQRRTIKTWCDRQALMPMLNEWCGRGGVVSAPSGHCLSFRM